MFRVVAPLLAVHKMTALRAWLAAPLVVDSVTSVSALSVVVPATAESNKPVIASLTVVPQVPDKSPVVGNANPRSGEKLVTAMSVPYVDISTQSGTCASSTPTQTVPCVLSIFCQSGTWVSSITFQ